MELDTKEDTKSFIPPVKREGIEMPAVDNQGDETINMKTSPAYRSAMFNLMNGIIGSGILGLPFAMANLGIASFLIALVGVTFLALFSIQNLLIMCDALRASTYESLVTRAFGNTGKYFVILMIYIHTFSAQCSYMTIVKEQLPEVIMTVLGMQGRCLTEGSFWLKGNNVVTVMLLLVVVPLSSLRKIDFLSFTSSIAMYSMALFSIIIIAFKFVISCPFEKAEHKDSCNYANVRQENSAEYKEFLGVVDSMNGTEGTCSMDYVYSSSVESLRVISAIPTLLFSFMCHTSLFPIYNEFHHALTGSQNSSPAGQRRSRFLMMHLAKKVFIVVFAGYMVVAFMGYYTWKEATVTSDILSPYSYTHPDSTWVMVARICSLICVIFSTPLLHYPGRRALTVLIAGHENDPDNVKTFSWSLHLGTMAVNMAGVWFITVYVATSIGQIWAYSCPLAANALLIVLPAACYMKFFGKTGQRRDQYSGKVAHISDNEDSGASSEESDKTVSPDVRLRLCKAMVIFGVVFFIFSLVLQLYKDFS